MRKQRCARSWWVAAAACVLWTAFPATAQTKIGVFDATRVSEETEEGKRVQRNLNDFRDKKQAAISAKEKELSDLQNRLNNQALSLSADKRSELDKEIQRKVLDVNQAREAASNEMRIEVSEAQDRFQQKLLAVVAQFGRDEGFSLILESSLVAYSDKAVDVTTAIVDRFNATFKVDTGESPAPSP
jgi:outer membrane protein